MLQHLVMLASVALPSPALKAHLEFVARLAPIPCRDDLAAVAERHFNSTGIAAEIGVNVGTFAAKNLARWSGDYWAVDAWAVGSNMVNARRPELPASTEKVNSPAFNAAAKRLRRYGTRAHQLRGFSVPTAKKNANGTFDWVYIDALHTYEAIHDDLRAWWPKVRDGGLFSGDDYGDMKDTENLPFERFANLLRQPSWGGITATIGWGDRNISESKFSELYAWGTVRAVQEFAVEVGAALHVTYLMDCYTFPAWYMVKPPKI